MEMQTYYQPVANAANNAASAVAEGAAQVATKKNIESAATHYAQGFVESQVPAYLTTALISAAMLAGGTFIGGPLGFFAAPLIVAPLTPYIANGAKSLAGLTVNKAAEVGQKVMGQPETVEEKAKPAPVNPIKAQTIAELLQPLQVQTPQVKKPEEKKAEPSQGMVVSYGQKAGATFGPTLYNLALTTVLSPFIGPAAAPLANFVIAPLTYGLLKHNMEEAGKKVASATYSVLNK